MSKEMKPFWIFCLGLVALVILSLTIMTLVRFGQWWFYVPTTAQQQEYQQCLYNTPLNAGSQCAYILKGITK